MNPYTPPRAEAGNYAPYPQSNAGAPGVADTAIELLRQTRPWVQFISILCFLGSAFMLMASAGMFLAGAVGGTSKTEAYPVAMVGAIYLPLAAVYIYPGIKLWSFASAISRLIVTRSASDLENALRHQKSFWKFSGISAIALMLLYVVIIAGIVLYSVMKATSTH